MMHVTTATAVSSALAPFGAQASARRRMALGVPKMEAPVARAARAAGVGGAARPPRLQQRRRPMPSPLRAAAADEVEEEEKSDDYTATMQSKMGGSLTYNHERGINYAYVMPDVIVGSCLQNPADVDTLAQEEGVTAVMCLQEDSDMAYFDLDLVPILERCHERGDIKHIRSPIHDFDPFSLRMNLKESVRRVAAALEGNKDGKAYEQLYNVRPCHPKLEAIRAATADLLVGKATVPCTLTMYRNAEFKSVEIAGLDVGWGLRVPLEYNNKMGRWETHRELAFGRYLYKYVVDRGDGEGDRWTYNVNTVCVEDGGHVNNCVTVIGDPAVMAARERLMTPGTVLTDEERARLREILVPGGSPAAAAAAGAAAGAAGAEETGGGGKKEGGFWSRLLRWLPFVN